MLYTWVTSDDFDLWKRLLYAIPDLAQVAAQFYLILSCFLDGFDPNFNFAYFLVNVVKAVQAFFLIFIVIEAYSEPNSDYFIGTFGAIKLSMNAINSLVYFLYDFEEEDLYV